MLIHAGVFATPPLFAAAYDDAADVMPITMPLLSSMPP